MRRVVWAVGLVLLAACGSASNATGPTTPESAGSSTSVTTANSGESSASTDANGSSSNGSGANGNANGSPTTIPRPTATFVGVVVGGNSGGVGEGSTDSLSDTVRLDDGTCRGWTPGGQGQWTGDLRGGATIEVLDGRTKKVLGKGELGVGEPADVNPNGDEQWQCSLSFDIPSVPVAKSYLVRVGGLDRWEAHPDPTKPNQFVVTVQEASTKLVPDCQQVPSTAVSTWDSVVGRYWSLGVRTLCRGRLRRHPDQPPVPPRQRRHRQHLGRVRRLDPRDPREAGQLDHRRCLHPPPGNGRGRDPRRRLPLRLTPTRHPGNPVHAGRSAQIRAE